MKNKLNYYKKKLYEKYKDEYIILTTDEEYDNNKNMNSHSNNVKFKHIICGTEFEKSLHGILQDEKCPLCSKTRQKSLNLYQQYLDFKFGKGIYEIPLENNAYIDNDTKFKIKHLVCGYEWEISPKNICELKTCKNCKTKMLQNYAYSKKLNIDIIKEKVKELNDEYEVLSNEYENNKSKLEIYHKKCNNIFYSSWNNFQGGCRCPICLESRGESEIRKWLEEKNYEFSTQATFPDCKYENLLKFDFKLEDVDEEDNLNKIILIEFDGIQHYEPVEAFGGEEEFKLQQIRDNVKNEYCASHDNIDLYRICYLDLEIIPEILTEIVRKYDEDIKEKCI